MAEPFRLARVLRLREQMRRLRSHEADQLAAQLAAAEMAVARVVDERERVGAREADDAATGKLTVDTLRLGRAYDAALATAEQVHALNVVQIGHALDAKRAELLRDRQEEEKYVRLAANHRERVLEDEARETDRALDEVAVQRFRRQQKEKERGHERV
ncbi:MAG: flagellar FliJ family protein [Candidatus Binatia bacterium]